VVTTAASALPGANAITFTVTSPTTSATDTKAESVLINTIRYLSLTPPNAGQIFPGGSVVYTHTLTNQGNVTEGDGTASTITLTHPTSGVTTGWSNIVYWDSNNNGVLDPADVVASGIALNTVGFTGLAPGTSVRLFVKVLAPASGAAGDINTSNLTAVVVGTISSVLAPAAVVASDTTTVIVGQVLLNKTQALDASCAGNFAGSTFSTASISSGAIPGACVLYKITATNVGTANVTGVVISDATPSNTVYKSFAGSAGVIPAASTTVGTMSSVPLDTAAGTIQAAVGTLTPGQVAVITFGVRINP
jgi:uncharacterized repeat protein (TIGR01451 family)